MSRHTPYVPADIIRRYLEDYLTTSTLRECANATRTDERVLYDILHGHRVHVRFDTADRILGGIGLAHEWYENEALSRIYAMA